ncbi:MAG: hypothetical protein R3D00_00015 [Bacteroidia bacterium]
MNDNFLYRVRILKKCFLLINLNHYPSEEIGNISILGKEINEDIMVPLTSGILSQQEIGLNLVQQIMRDGMLKWPDIQIAGSVKIDILIVDGDNGTQTTASPEKVLLSSPNFLKEVSNMFFPGAN